MEQGMGIVGSHLANAANEKAGMEKDSFARSAFNRYYYSAFLEIRSVLQQLNPAWSRPNHADVPELLEKAAIKQIKLEVKKAEDKGLLKRGQAESIRTRSNAAASELASLFTTAREVRRIADYEPEILVQIDGNKYTLNSYSLASAAGWKKQVSVQSKTLLKVYSELGLI